ncbi:UNKNOWN [Stylonychia lemnae]|uniref:Uncharacterized protein n=1 Tax=Stylonychia lemnae TaxID=5949 RepID=A0A078ALZ7_STYLE|nr:UNKNOWN [Stylonychia lemnae]|eukprot:CDW82437.1 UNKNOWN [Stylonychia lemnae]
MVGLMLFYQHLIEFIQNLEDLLVNTINHHIQNVILKEVVLNVIPITLIDAQYIIILFHILLKLKAAYHTNSLVLAVLYSARLINHLTNNGVLTLMILRIARLVKMVWCLVCLLAMMVIFRLQIQKHVLKLAKLDFMEILNTILDQEEQSVGTCQQKSSESYEDTIYVGSIGRLNTRDNSLIDGSINNYFNSIQDAIKKAYELGAPYQSAQITILLLDGTHAMVRYYPLDFYMPTNLDQFSKTTKIILQPANPDQQLTINYKLRDTFHFIVGAGLTIKNLIFDAIDSSIDMDTDINQQIYCSSNPSKQCCYIDSNGQLGGQPSCKFIKEPYLFYIFIVLVLSYALLLKEQTSLISI